MIEEAAGGDRAARVAESVLRALPRWFGLEEPLLAYVEAARRLPTLIAVEGEVDVGFLTLEQRTARAAEIVAMVFSRAGTGAESDAGWSTQLRIARPRWA